MSTLWRWKTNRRWFGTGALSIAVLFITLAAATGTARSVPVDSTACEATKPGLLGYAPSYFGNPVRLDVQGNYAYLVDWSGSLEVFDIGDPCQPVSLGSAQWTANEFSDVAVVGDYAYVANDADGLAKYDVSDPAAPFRVAARKDGTGLANSVAYPGGLYAYVGQHYAAGAELAIVYKPEDFNFPPTFYSPGAGWPHIWEVTVQKTIASDFVYISAGDGQGNTLFQILKFEDYYTEPTLLGALELPLDTYGNGFAIEVRGDYAYLSALDYPPYDGGLVVVNIADKSAPFVKGHVTIPNSGVVPWKRPGLDAAGDEVTMMGRDALVVFDVSDPSKPVQKAQYSFPASFGESDGGDVVLQGDLAITAVTSHDPAGPDDHGGLAIYRRAPALQNGDQTELLSLAWNGNLANGASGAPAISSDGRIVAFQSEASNIVTGDPDRDFCFDYFGLPYNCLDIFVLDRLTGETTRTTANLRDVEGPGDAFEAAISADGQSIVFSFENSETGTQVFVTDRQTGKTKCVSVDSSGQRGNGDSYRPAISADGRFVAFLSAADNLVSGDSNDSDDIFVHDRLTGLTTRVSVNSSGEQGDDRSTGRPSLSADGRLVAFESEASNLVDGDTNGSWDIFVHDRQTGQTTRVSVSSAGAQGDRHSLGANISADGRLVAFDSWASNLVDGDTNDAYDVFVHDRQTGETIRVSVSSAGKEGDQNSFTAAGLMAGGRYVAFASFASTLVSDDTNGATDVFLHDLQTRETSRLSLSATGEQGNGDSVGPALSADGRFALFSSGASNLIGGDINGWSDIFVRDLLDPFTPPDNPEGIVNAGEYHSCGLKRDGSADCWGAKIAANDHGQAEDQAGPFVQVGSGALHSCGLRVDGRAACWGNNDYGQAEEQAGPFTQISAGGDHNCGLKPDGQVICWGRNDHGQAEDQAGPFAQISAGWQHACGLAPGGSIVCWGADYFGETVSKDGPYIQVSAGWGHTCGLKANGRVDCWGRNENGQAEDQFGSFVQISAGGRHTCGLAVDGQVACWGFNKDGQAEGQAGPFVQVSAGGTWLAGSERWGHTCGLKPDGSITCWGSNQDGQAESQTGPFGRYEPPTIMLPLVLRD